jgi:hypothetical protein
MSTYALDCASSAPTGRARPSFRTLSGAREGAGQTSGYTMKFHTLRRMAPLAAAAMLLTAMPLTASAAPVTAQDEHDDNGDESPGPNNEGTQVLCAPAQLGGPAFEDTENSLFAYWIDCLAFHDIVEGREDGTYRPRNTVTRGQMAKFIANSVEFFGEELDSSDAGLEDVDDDDVFSEWINKVVNAEIASGFEDGTYRSTDTVRRDQMARFVANAVEYVTEEELEISGETFPDVPDNSVFITEIDKVATADIVDGRTDGTYGPRETVRRDQMAKFVAEGMGVTAEAMPFLPGDGEGEELFVQLEDALAPLLAELSEGDVQQIEDALAALRDEFEGGDDETQEQIEAVLAELSAELEGLEDAIQDGALDEDDLESLVFAIVTALELLAEGDVEGALAVIETVVAGLLDGLPLDDLLDELDDDLLDDDLLDDLVDDLLDDDLLDDDPVGGLLG